MTRWNGLVSYIAPTLSDDDKKHDAVGVQYWRFSLQGRETYDDGSQIYKTLYKEYQRKAMWSAMKIVKV